MYVKVRTHPSSKKERVTHTQEHEYEIRIKEPAERNLANTRVREIIAREYQVPLGQVRIISGHRSRTKIIGIN